LSEKQKESIIRAELKQCISILSIISILITLLFYLKEDAEDGQTVG